MTTTSARPTDARRAAGKPPPGPDLLDRPGSSRGTAPLLVAPAWLFMTAIGIIPIVYALWMSMTNHSLADTEHPFIGFANYVSVVFTESFALSLFVTVVFVVGGLAIQLPLGYLLADCLHRQLRGFKIARSVLLIPMLLTPVVVGLMGQFMFSPGLGLIDATLSALGLQVDWLGDPWMARFLIVIMDSWIHIPFVMLLLVAGMSAVPNELVEAAQLDGAGWWARTRYVMLPMLKTVLLITVLVRCVELARLFDLIYTTTKGGPGTATQNTSLRVYDSTFQFYDVGSGAAMAIALAIAMFPVYFAYVRSTRS